MTDSQEPEGQNDLSAAPEYKQLGEEGNPFSTDDGLDDVAATHPDGGDDDEQNAPLPDGGPTDGEHGVDGVDGPNE